MTEYEHDWERNDVEPRVRSLFWRGYFLGLLTVVAIVGCMYV